MSDEPQNSATAEDPVTSTAHNLDSHDEQSDDQTEQSEEETAGQSEEESSDGTDGGGESTTPPALSVTGEEWLEVKLPLEVSVYKTVSTWNSWRQSLKQVKIKLDSEGKAFLQDGNWKLISGFNFSSMDLSEYKLHDKIADGTDFSDAKLNGTDFTGSDLRRAKFKGADLTGANLVETRLSGAVLDEETIFDRIKQDENITIGINGIYVRRKQKRADEEPESAALMTLTPAGDSMKGNSAASVVENLSHSRKLHTSSILLSAIVATIVLMDITKFKVSALEGIELPIGIMAIFSAAISLIYEILVLTHLRDAADGATYLQSREDAMKVGLFPWGLSSYAARRTSKRTVRGGFIDRIAKRSPRDIGQLLLKGREISFGIKERFPYYSKELIRLMTAFHSILFLATGILVYNRKYDRYGGWLLIRSPKSVIFVILVSLLLFTSLLIYLEARRFRRPIVFDMETQKASRNDMASLATSIAEQLRVTRRLASFIETAVPRYPNAGDYIVDRLPDGVEVVMRRIPAGEFLMGSDENEVGSNESERPQHQVDIREFWISPYQVTQQLWVSVIGSLPAELMHKKNFNNARFPIICVSWDSAVVFCKKLNDLLGLPEEYGYRLPTEAEWEYAARAGSRFAFAFGDDHMKLSDYAWYFDNSGQSPHEVGEKKPNSFDLYDVSGNVGEWCQDHWHNNYNGAPKDGSVWLGGDLSEFRVNRGGSWGRDATLCRSSVRVKREPGYYSVYIGFRLSRTLPSALFTLKPQSDGPSDRKEAATGLEAGPAEAAREQTEAAHQTSNSNQDRQD